MNEQDQFRQALANIITSQDMSHMISKLPPWMLSTLKETVGGAVVDTLVLDGEKVQRTSEQERLMAMFLFGFACGHEWVVNYWKLPQ